jgi:hypothetical protein
MKDKSGIATIAKPNPVSPCVKEAKKRINAERIKM